MRIGRALGLGVVVASVMVATACSNNSTSGSSNNSGGGGGGSKGTVVISGQNFGEMQIMASMYQQVLQKAGYTVPTPKLVTTRDTYVPELKSGKVDVVPDYLAGMADFLNTSAHGANAPELSTHSPQTTLAKMKPLATAAGITMLKPAKATDQNAFAVTTKFAKQNHLTTLSDLAALKKPIVLAAPPDCKGRSDCEGGLTKVYKLDITKIIPLDYDSAAAKDSVTKGESQLGEVATTDAALSQEGLTALQDDKGIQPAQNLIPATNTAFIKAHPDIATVLNKLSATLTTKDLAQMDMQVAVNRQQPADVAKSYLQSKGLL
jgi:osmoprotectant transport system substrate-binding protein